MDHTSITWRMSLEASLYCTLFVAWKAARPTLYKGKHLEIGLLKQTSAEVGQSSMCFASLFRSYIEDVICYVRNDSSSVLACL